LSVGAASARQFLFPERHIEVVDSIVYEVNRRGDRLGIIDMPGGLQTHLTDNRVFDLNDPYWTGLHHFWSSDEPFVDTLDDAVSIFIPLKSFYEESGYGDRQRKVMVEVGDKLALIGDCTSPTLAFVVAMRGMTRTMFDLMERPELVHALMEKGVEIAAERGKFNIDLGLKVLRINDSVANMSVISPDHWRQFVFPHMRDLCTKLHRYDKDVLLYCHICGNVLPVIEDIVATGMDCIGPLDPLGGFSCSDVRKKVDNRVSLLGGVDTQSFVRGNSFSLELEARRCILEAGARGGYVLGSGCAIPRTALSENLMALTKAAKRFGQYSSGRLSNTD